MPNEFDFLKHLMNKNKKSEADLPWTTSVKLKKKHQKFLQENEDFILSHFVIEMLDQLIELNEKQKRSNSE